MFEPGLKPGDLVGPYEIRGFLGQGGMGTVYRAYDPRLERTVALKVIVAHPSRGTTVPPESAGRAAEMSARLFREARAVASLTHPNVVAIYDVGQTEGLLYLAMEYVVGRTLRTLVGDPGVPLGRRLRWLVDTARALDAAHRGGVVHRDVKPENVMVRDDGAVKVLDFGIARRTVAGADRPEGARGSLAVSTDTVTGGGAISGTPVYMAPEQIRGDVVDARADQFGWGVTAYELLAGHRPWVEGAGDTLGLVARMLTEAPPPLRRAVPETPHRVEETIARALSKEAAARFASMSDAADALEPFASQATGDGRIRVSPGMEEGEAYAATTRVPASLSLTPSPGASSPSNEENRARPAPRARQLVLPLALLVALVSGTALLVTRHPPGDAGATSTRDRPLSQVPEADKAYREALSLWRDGATARALEQLRRATSLDPSFSAAHLELAVQTTADDPQTAQTSFQRAFEHRQMLLPRDVALLEASEPYVRPKPDLDEWETRLTAAVFQYPRDPELQFYLGRSRERLGEDAEAKLAYEAALKLDPSFVPALAALANVERSLGDDRAALATTERCVTRSPVATACVEKRFELFSQSGQCRQARDEAERWAALEPQSAAPASAFARALHADGAPKPGVEEALSRAWSLAPPARRASAELWDRTHLAAQAGELARADDLIRGYDGTLPKAADRWDHAQPARLRMNLLFELDKPKEAAAVARAFLDRMDAWPPYPYAPDPSFAFQEALFRAGETTREAMGAARVRWIEAEEARLSAEERPTNGQWPTWNAAWGALVETREEAAAALEAAPRSPLPRGGRRALALDFNLGKAYALTGQGAVAQEHLARVTATCTSFDAAMLVVRARYYEGLAFESLGDRAAARRSYAAVLQAWPETLGSRTSRWAAARLVALR